MPGRHFLLPPAPRPFPCPPRSAGILCPALVPGAGARPSQAETWHSLIPRIVAKSKQGDTPRTGGSLPAGMGDGDANDRLGLAFSGLRGDGHVNYALKSPTGHCPAGDCYFLASRPFPASPLLRWSRFPVGALLPWSLRPNAVGA